VHPVKAVRLRTKRLELATHREWQRLKFHRVWRDYRYASMVPPVWATDNLMLCSQITVPGAIVECGTWNGGMSAAMATVLPGRISVLLDSFEGLPVPRDIDGQRSASWGGELKADAAVAYDVMMRTGERFEIHPGWFDDTVPDVAAHVGPIAVLRLDGDWYDSTMTCLTHLFPLVTPGGLVILDDYEVWPGCTRAVHDYLSREGRTEPIRQYGRAFYLRVK
jgi:O-methyltransferase